MAGTGWPALSRSGAPLRSSLLRLWARRRADDGGGGNAEQVADPLLAVGRQLRQRREERGLSLRKLALQTRISTPVLEALERGWRDRLPEAAYLRAMLPLIEAELELPPGCLAPALPAEPGLAQRRPQRRFTPGSIDVFSTWQGTVLYGLLTLGLIYALNLEQQRLAASGRLALRPIPPLPLAQQRQPTPPGQSLLRLHPELRPLDLAARGQALRQLRQDAGRPAAAAPGILELELGQSSRLSLTAAGSLASELEGASGQLRLPVAPPFQLRLDPPPGPGSRVLWNGQPLRALPDQPGVFAAPEAVPQAPPRPAARASSP